MDGNLGEVRSFDMVIPESGRTTRSRQVLKQSQTTRYVLLHMSLHSKKTTTSAFLKCILGRRPFKMADAKMGWRDWSKRSGFVHASYLVGYKETSPIHDVPLAPCHSSSGSISDVNGLSRRAKRLSTPWIHGRHSSTAEI